MTLDAVYSKWLSIQPLTEAERTLLRMRFTVEYNYNSNHLEGNTLTYGQTELLLLFGKVSGEGHLKDFNDMKASDVSVRMMSEEAVNKKTPLTQNFIRTLHRTLLREDYTELLVSAKHRIRRFSSAKRLKLRCAVPEIKS